MASYTAVNGALEALESFLDRRLPAELTGGQINARVDVFGSDDFTNPINGNVLGLYVHRVEVDPHGRARMFSAQGAGQQNQARELPINLHILLIASASSATIEMDLISWAMIELANESQLDISHMSQHDESWTEREMLTITPAEMSNEDLLRIWDALDLSYTSSVPYVLRTIRLRLRDIEQYGPPVSTRVFPTGKALAGEE